MLPRTPQNRTRIEVLSINVPRDSLSTLLSLNSNVENMAHPAQKLNGPFLLAVMAITKLRFVQDRGLFILTSRTRAKRLLGGGNTRDKGPVCGREIAERTCLASEK